MSHPHHRRVDPNATFRLVVVQDQPQSCPYVDAETARMPLELPIGPVGQEFTDWMLAGGYRRSGDFVYRTRCPRCNECKPTRLIAKQFHWSKSFRRILNRGDRELTLRWQASTVDQQRVDLFNQHRVQRGLDTHDTEISVDSYHAFLVSSFGQSEELSVWMDDRLIAVSVVDVGRDCLSAVYTFFDPDQGRFSLGTYVILKQIQRAVREQLRYVYLGMYVSSNRHLNYKARFGPQQRFIEGTWRDIDVLA